MTRNRRPLRSISLNLKEGNNIDELRTAYSTRADAVTHELEDHCPARFKDVARRNIRQVIDDHGQEKPTFVRTGMVNDPAFLDDLEAIVSKNLYGVMLPKVRNDEDLRKCDYLLNLMEARAGLEQGSICILPLLETANGHRLAYEIASASERVEYMISGTNTNGDPARSIGYQWTRECTETLYIRQKIVLDARSAGMQWPVCSNWNAMDDLEGLENFLIQNRQIGYFGSLCSPEPTYVDIVNRVFTPSQQEIDFWGEIVALQEEHDDDVKIEGKWYVRNKLLWGRLRLDLAAHFGVHPNLENRRMELQQVGGLVKDAEAEKVGNAGTAIV